ncbi:PREDICTED: putative PRAME family member 26-like [Elephantulus edwardii]|uniref:putative PRAME family member 26-like n=1 Tax=Elephantulus edwardii TaxID=28737 RepID=UPI0003F0B5E5|nr:PREDICTED: putative PRAME family member 26-like [Elephantulus edwardii]
MGKVDDIRKREKQPLASVDVLLKLDLNEAFQDQWLILFFQGPQESKGHLYLRYGSLDLIAVPLTNIEGILNTGPVDCSQIVNVQCYWAWPSSFRITPHLVEFLSKFLSLHQLEELYLDSVSCLQGHLEQLLRCLKTPLKTLWIRNCVLLDSDLTYLSSCPITSHLTRLTLSGVNLTGLSLQFLQVLLHRVSATIRYLDLESCEITDSEVTAILPALNRCNLLTVFNFSENSVSRLATNIPQG